MNQPERVLCLPLISVASPNFLLPVHKFTTTKHVQRMHTLCAARRRAPLPHQWHLHLRRQPLHLAHAPRPLLSRPHHEHHHSRAHHRALQRLMAADLPRILRRHKAPRRSAVYESLLRLLESEWQHYYRIGVHGGEWLCAE